MPRFLSPSWLLAVKMLTSVNLGSICTLQFLWRFYQKPIVKKPHILIPEICGNPGSENILWLVFPMALVQTQFAEENQKALQFAQVHVFKAGAKYNMRPWHQNREFDKL